MPTYMAQYVATLRKCVQFSLPDGFNLELNNYKILMSNLYKYSSDFRKVVEFMHICHNPKYRKNPNSTIIPQLHKSTSLSSKETLSAKISLSGLYLELIPSGQKVADDLAQQYH